MKLNERKLNILKAIVKDYIETAEAVGSRTISKKHDLGISAATIRNDTAPYFCRKSSVRKRI